MSRTRCDAGSPPIRGVWPRVAAPSTRPRISACRPASSPRSSPIIGGSTATPDADACHLLNCVDARLNSALRFREAHTSSTLNNGVTMSAEFVAYLKREHDRLERELDAATKRRFPDQFEIA